MMLVSLPHRGMNNCRIELLAHLRTVAKFALLRTALPEKKSGLIFAPNGNRSYLKSLCMELDDAAASIDQGAWILCGCLRQI